jgi:hypothetical protein
MTKNRFTQEQVLPPSRTQSELTCPDARLPPIGHQYRIAGAPPGTPLIGGACRECRCTKIDYVCSH